LESSLLPAHPIALRLGCSALNHPRPPHHSWDDRRPLSHSPQGRTCGWRCLPQAHVATRALGLRNERHSGGDVSTQAMPIPHSACGSTTRRAEGGRATSAEGGTPPSHPTKESPNHHTQDHHEHGRHRHPAAATDCDTCSVSPSWPTVPTQAQSATLARGPQPTKSTPQGIHHSPPPPFTPPTKHIVVMFGYTPPQHNPIARGGSNPHTACKRSKAQYALSTPVRL
jgi:hypothetical protein